MNLVKGSLQDELDQFFSEINDEDCDFRHVTKSAFCQARQKISHKAFIELNDHMTEQFFQSKTSRWHGLRLLGIDGSTFRLPKTEAIADYFGRQEQGPPLARVSFCTDTASGVALDTIVMPYTTGEREMAIAHLKKTMANDLILYDRGYHGFFMFALHRDQKRDFCMRMPLDQYTAITEFIDSGSVDALITIEPTGEAKKQCKDLHLSKKPLVLRAIRIELSTGETEVLVTSLLDHNQYPTHEFQALYHQRWSVEESIKQKKCPLEIENFTGLSVEVVLQDIYAKIFMYNLVAIARTISQKTVDEYCKGRKHRYKVNATQALSKAKDVLIRIALLSTQKAKILVGKFLDILAKSIEPIREGRSYPRNHLSYKKIYHPNIKRTR